MGGLNPQSVYRARKNGAAREIMNIPPPFPLPDGILVELSSQSSTLYPFAGWLTRLRIPSPKSNPTFSSTASSGGTVGAGAGGSNGHRGSGKSAPPDTGAVESGEGGLGDSARRCYCVLVGGNLLWEYASEADAAAAPLAHVRRMNSSVFLRRRVSV